MNQERITAVASALSDQNGWTSYDDARKAINASDDVMFSDEAIERAARAIHDAGSIDKKPWAERNDEIRELYREDVRMVIAALKGDA